MSVLLHLVPSWPAYKNAVLLLHLLLIFHFSFCFASFQDHTTIFSGGLSLLKSWRALHRPSDRSWRPCFQPQDHHLKLIVYSSQLLRLRLRPRPRPWFRLLTALAGQKPKAQAPSLLVRTVGNRCTILKTSALANLHRDLEGSRSPPVSSIYSIRA